MSKGESICIQAKAAMFPTMPEHTGQQLIGCGPLSEKFSTWSSPSCGHSTLNKKLPKAAYTCRVLDNIQPV